MTFSTKWGIHYTIFSEPRRVDYEILSKDGDLYKKYKAGWSLLFHHSVRPLLGWLPIQ